MVLLQATRVGKACYACVSWCACVRSLHPSDVSAGLNNNQLAAAGGGEAVLLSSMAVKLVVVLICMELLSAMLSGGGALQGGNLLAVCLCQIS